jgi:hypothetical protein
VPPDVFGGSYESECRPEGPYGAISEIDGTNYKPFFEDQVPCFAINELIHPYPYCVSRTDPSVD